MLAARWYGRKDIRVVEVPVPANPKPGWLIARVDACGLCGTDIEEYLHGPLLTPVDVPFPLTGATAPLTLGHELVGTVTEVVGDGVTLTPGTRVAIEGNLFCGHCEWCKAGQYNICPSAGQLGQRTDGGLAHYVATPEYCCIPYTDQLPAEQAALAEPLSVAVRAIRRGGVGVGTRVGVVGGGTIGLLTAQVARIAGADTVLLVEPHPGRRALAAKFGVTVAVTPAEAEAAAGPATGGHGLDVVLDCAGVQAATPQAIKLTRRGGRTVLVAIYPGDLTFDPLDFLGSEKELVASMSHLYTSDYPDAVRLLETGRVDVRPLITDQVALPDVVKAGFEALVARPQDHLKVIVRPSPAGD
jgi:(R,R)-butanediol dehydrogenase/meso-butanediol dehydrogenase/diacetyl reductase